MEGPSGEHAGLTSSSTAVVMPRADLYDDVFGSLRAVNKITKTGRQEGCEQASPWHPGWVDSRRRPSEAPLSLVFSLALCLATGLLRIGPCMGLGGSARG